MDRGDKGSVPGEDPATRCPGTSDRHTQDFPGASKIAPKTRPEKREQKGRKRNLYGP